MAMTDAAWPYDALQDDPLTPLRIPVTTRWPDWSYLVASVGVPIADEPCPRPTDREAAQLASYIDWLRHTRYTAALRAKLREQPFDVDEHFNTLILHKWGHDDWGRWSSPSHRGPSFVPGPGSHGLAMRNGAIAPLSLVALLDLENTFAEHASPDHKWRAWKSADRDLFAESS